MAQLNYENEAQSSTPDRTPLAVAQVRKRLKVIICLMFLVAFGLRIATAVATQDYAEPAVGEALLVAHSVAVNGVFGNPYQFPTGPTAHLAPVYPYFLALLMALHPAWSFATWLYIVLGATGSALVWSMLPYISARLQIGFRPGIIAGVIGAVTPLRRYSETGFWEATYASLALMFLIALSFRLRARIWRGWSPLLFGLAWGVSFLLQPAFIPVFAAVFVLLAWKDRVHLSPALSRTGGLIALGILVALAPWTVRNYKQLGGLVLVRSNFGLELDLSNREGAMPSGIDNLHRNKSSDHPDRNQAEARRMAKMGELPYYQMRLQRALAWIETHPQTFGSLTVHRFFYFWVPERRSAMLRGIEAVETAAALAGLVLLFRRKRATAPFIAALWIFFPLVYYLIQAFERYRYPIEWSICLCVGYAVWYAYSSVSSARRRRATLYPGPTTAAARNIG